MRTGVLKLWKREHGFGFIKDDTNGSDIFVHKIAFQVAGIDPDLIVVGTRLIYEVEPTRDNRTRACNVRLCPSWV
jgi:cold shock CspA family protein